MANEHLKRCLTSLAIRENANQNHNDIPKYTNRMANSVGEDIEKVELSYIAAGNVNMV